MKLLMITRKIDRDDWLAGHSWEWAVKIKSKIIRNGGQKSKLTIICLEKGNVSGLDGVDIYSLGKETNNTRWQRFWRFQKLALRLVRDCDGIFCHQNPEYAIAIAVWAKLFRKKVVSWYTHKSVTWKTRAMLMVSDTVLTASKESFRLSSTKVKVLGHGIDTDLFHSAGTRQVNRRGGDFVIATIGRITPAKDLETLVLAMGELRQNNGHEKILLRVIGEPAYAEDWKYLDSLKKIVQRLHLTDRISFEKSIPHPQIHEVYQSIDLFINLSQTGSLDKAILEAMACECPVVTSNEAFFEILKPVGNILLTKPNDSKMLASKIFGIVTLSDIRRQELGSALRRIVLEGHDLDSLVKKILDNFLTRDV